MRGFDRTPARFPWRSAASTEDPVIEPLSPRSVCDLRLPWLSRYNLEKLRGSVETYQGMAHWVPATGEYVISEPWRRRSEIAQIGEVTARKGKAALVRAHVESLTRTGQRAVLVAEDVWQADPALYATLGFELRERIVFFHRDLRGRGSPGYGELPKLTFSRLALDDLEPLLRLDHASFPWIWWNSRAEFESYMPIVGVYSYAAMRDREPIGYASFTMYDGWGHLDRLAVIDGHTGRGYGAAQLVNALDIMAGLGARSVRLSTQENNAPSHALYRRFGFTETREKMHIYGRMLDARPAGSD